MLSPKYCVYAAVGPKQYKIAISSNPRIDARLLADWGYDLLWLIQPSLPLWLAEKVLAEFKGKSFVGKPKAFKEQVEFVLEPFVSLKLIRLVLINIEGSSQSEQIPDQLEQLFWGRNLLGSEIPAVLRKSGYDLPWDPEDWMQSLTVHGKITRQAAVSRDGFGLPVCRRCGSTEGIIEEYCYLCGSTTCLTCTHCQSMGIAKSCIPLYYVADPRVNVGREPVEPLLEFELTPPQQRAADQVVAFYRTEAPRFLVWAVCGSGKTEVSFGIVAKALTEGGRVLFAIPRRDIVIELLPRFAKAFPGVTISARYGGSGGVNGEDAMLTLATTHQCLRFYQCFDLIVLDEADAFPYQGSGMLHVAVERSLKPGGKLVIMTATPSRNLTELAQAGKLPFVSIPVRPHGRPLVVPQYVKLHLDSVGDGKEWRPPEWILRQIKESVLKKKRLLIFLPTLRLVEIVGKQLVGWGRANGIHGDWTHSRQNNRIDTKDQLLKSELHFLVTSTIYERGITIPDLDVIVLYADYDSIFDERTLIQIAGRVGRYGEPAEVFFVSKTTNRAMKECCATIERMNNEARQLGYVMV